MNDYDKLFENSAEGSEVMYSKVDPAFDKEAWIERKRQERADAYALLDEGTLEVAKDPESFRDYLNVQARFDRYSVSNAVLIAHQRRDATRIADFNSWEEEGVSVKKGEQSLVILEPGSEYTREDGTTGFSVNVKKVFDISQTDSTEAVKRRTFDERSAIKALVESSPCEIVLVKELKDANARNSPEHGKIFIASGLSANDIFRSLAYEINIAKAASKGISREENAFQSYCASYILCERYGFDTGDFNFERVPERLANASAKDVRKELSGIRDSANEISQDMMRRLDAVEKNKRARDDGAR